MGNGSINDDWFTLMHTCRIKMKAGSLTMGIGFSLKLQSQPKSCWKVKLIIRLVYRLEIFIAH